VQGFFRLYLLKLDGSG